MTLINRHASAFAALAFAGSGVADVSIVLDYTYDSTNFFSNNAQAKAALESAASTLSGILGDEFSAIETPETYNSSMFSGQVDWSWSQSFSHPSMGTNVTINNGTVNANEYVIFAGVQQLGGTTLGRGGPGGFGWSSTPSGLFAASEIDEINVITADFASAVEDRQDAPGFAGWGGAVTFDTDSDWNYNHNDDPSGGENDFFSVALHEIAHTLGLGGSDEWNALVTEALDGLSATFGGTSSVASHGGPIDLDKGEDTDWAHWAEGVESDLFFGSGLQETLMDPTLTTGTRKYLTELDVAALEDIGWTIVPEPGSAALVIAGSAALIRRRRA